MRRSNRYVNVLDIQDRYVRCSQLIYQDNKWSIYKSLKEEIQSIDKDLDTSSIIKSMIQEMNISKDLIVSISGRDASVRLLDLPPINDKRFKNMNGMLRYELGPLLPMDIDQMYYDYQIVETDSQATRVLTASIKRSVLTRYIDILSQVGVYPDVITISSAAIFNAFIMSEPHKIGQPIGLVCLRESVGDVVIIEHEHLTYARSFNISENNIVREINNSFDAYFKTCSSKATLDQIPIYLINPEEVNHHTDLTDIISQIPAQWHTLPTNCNFTSGLAMSGDFKLNHSQFIRINLLRQVIQEDQGVRRKKSQTRLLKLAPAISMFIMLVISCALWWQTSQEKSKLHSIEATLQTNVKQFNNKASLKYTMNKLDKQIESLDWVTEDYPMVSYRLYRIAQMVPDNVWLKEIYIPEINVDKKKKQENPISKLNVVGYAHEQNQIESFLENLRRCDCFSDVKQESASEITLIGERLLEFDIALTSSKYGSSDQWFHTIKNGKSEY